MFLWLIRHIGLFRRHVEAHTAGDTSVFLTARTAAAGLTAFLLAICLGPPAIRWLRRRFRERIASASPTLNQLHAAKQNTPTMGGIFLMTAVGFATLVWADLSSQLVGIVLWLVVSLTVLGAADDWIKQRTDRNGLSVRQKLRIQLAISAIAAIWLSVQQPPAPIADSVFIPVGRGLVSLSLLYVPWCMFIIVGTSNAVNLTDGLDGLAAGCSLFTAASFALLTWLSGHRELAAYLSIPHVSGAGEVTVTLGALLGALLGFLWYNCHPAKVFMGDAGSLPIGGLLAVAALVCRQELLLAVIGGVFVVETLSVILQVTVYRRTGKRPLRCSPLHNHFVFRGDHETAIVTRFWIVSAVLSVIGLGLLQLR
ncbi:MAG: phospho-N-acetylmuramoyl-pentapeptide-transferase [Planctomycetaceae bacterium]|nr:phospho-N-acetylmuramoyl-pentapeptide-transferase [Planctomycetaceae bacterium]